MSSSSSWQDRRFMFPAGRQIHEGSSSYVPPPAGAAQSPPVSIPSTTTSTSGASGSPPSSGKILPSWEGDRRFMFPTAKELHQPGRRLSGSSGSDKSTASAAAKATAPVASAASSAASAVTNPIANAIAGRRRSSASSQGGMFSGLVARRGSNENNDRRQSWEDVRGNQGGFLSNILGKPADKK